MEPIAPITFTPRPIAPVETGPTSTGPGFVSMLKDAVAEVVKTQQAAQAATESFAAGRTSDVAATMIAVERAAITLQLMLQVRNHLLEAYQEIQKLQV
jgi:flagellar hook-basal body complex protein FliE